VTRGIYTEEAQARHFNMVTNLENLFGSEVRGVTCLFVNTAFVCSRYPSTARGNVWRWCDIQATLGHLLPHVCVCQDRCDWR